MTSGITAVLTCIAITLCPHLAVHASHIRFFVKILPEIGPVQIYEYQNFTTCTNNPTLRYAVEYIKSDSCVILYKNKDCLETDESVKVGASDQFTYIPKLFSGGRFASFRTCNDAPGANNINVEFYSYRNEADPSGSVIADQFLDLCSCQPLIGRNEIKSVDTHGNCIQVFEDYACTGNGTKIIGGNYAITYSIGSVRFCEEPSHCLKSNATVVKLEIEPSSDKHLLRLSKTSDMQLSAKTTYMNNGSAVVTQEYIAKKGLQTTMTITRVKSLSTTNRIKVGVDVKVEQKFGIPEIEKTKISAQFSFAYTYEWTYTSVDSQTYSSTETTEFDASQRIEIQPCTKYEVDSFVTIRQNFPLQYAIYVQYSARLGDTWLTAQELKERLVDMAWIEDVNNYTILIKGKSTAMVDFGVEAFFTGTGTPIEGCIK